MKNFKNLISISFLLVVLYNISFSQDSLRIFTYPSEKEIDIIVNATAVLDDKYNYSYKVNSSTSSLQRVRRFAIVHLSAVESLRAPISWVVRIAPKTIIRVSWSARDSVSRIAPGGELAGFRFKSYGLPSPGNFYATGWVEVPGFSEGEWPDSIVGGVFPENSFYGRTLVPKDPPTPFNNISFLDTIKSYVNQSRSLGWVADTTTKNKYISLLDSARHEMERFYSDGARPVFSTVLQDVVTDTLQALLSSEAYALIHFNTEYLRDHLPRSFTLTLPIVGSGTISKSLDNPTYDSTAVVQLTATPSSGYIFSGWSGDTTTSADTLTVTMNSNKTITATFTQNIFNITASAGANGNITPSGDVSVNSGNSQIFAIASNSCYHIDSVIVDGVKIDSTTSYTFINVTANHTIRTVYKINTYTLTPTSSGNGSISPDSSVIVNCSGSQRFTFTPATGYHVDTVLVDGNYVDSLAGYTFINVTSSHTIYVKFAINRYTLTVAANPSNGGTTNPSGVTTHDSNMVVPITATSNSGYRFLQWSGDASGTANPVSITMNSNKIVTANFKKTFQVTVQTNPSGRTFSVDGANYSTTQVFTWDTASTHTLATTSPQSVTAGTQYVWTSWSGGGAMSHSIMVSASFSDTAKFKKQYQDTVTTNPTGRSFTIDGTGYTALQTQWWDSGSVHTIATTSPQSGGTGMQYAYTNWSDGGAMSHSVTATLSKKYTANFNTQYQLTVVSNPTAGGTTSPSGSIYYNSGANVSLSATSACPGYKFNGWSGDASGLSNPITVVMNAPKKDTANFVTATTYTLTVSISGSGTVTKNPNLQCYVSGTTVTLTATPTAPDWVFYKWTGSVTSTANPLTITMNGNKSLTATFKFTSTKPPGE